ncbi:SDR family oxidoreductase [Nissabacter sp. SGAir0207]|uniref:SDR family oxidoreductase n=1 Tax=Nissabacter sp. SGAir0207 TaxID=2126321 RepID=UPI00197DDA47|nr:SDR family oxidoreductase [Nissabacter sp. SGAir0207]
MNNAGDEKTGAGQAAGEENNIPEPVYIDPEYKAAGKLKGKVAMITGGDSGIGRAVAIAFAKEGADLALLYLKHGDDAEATRQETEKWGAKTVLIAGDIGDEAFCHQAVAQVHEAFGQIDIVVNNAGEQHPQKDFDDITAEQLQQTFRTNFFGMFYLTQAAVRKMKEGAVVINTSSLTAYHGNAELIDYSATKGAITVFTRSLALNLAPRGIRVNGVAPGPIWTPLITGSFAGEDVEKFGTDLPFGAGQPADLAPAYVYLASDDSRYVSGQMLHVNGGAIVNG